MSKVNKSTSEPYNIEERKEPLRKDKLEKPPSSKSSRRGRDDPNKPDVKKSMKSENDKMRNIL